MAFNGSCPHITMNGFNSHSIKPEDSLIGTQWTLTSRVLSDLADYSVHHLTQRIDPCLSSNSDSLQMAMDREEIVAFYQPKFDLRSYRMNGVEALARWQHPERGVMTASSFLGQLHQPGLSSQLMVRMIDQVAAAIKRWQVMRCYLTVSVNVMWPEVENGSVGRVMEAVCSSFGIAPQSLQVELSEQLPIQNLNTAMMEIRKLRAGGFSVAIDDFGAGSSSLGLLRHIECDAIKLDCSLVQGVGNDHRSAVLLKSLIAMAEGMGAEIVAEGVENVGDLECLIELGCHQMQGNLYGVPMPESELISHYFRKDNEMARERACEYMALS